MHLSQVKSLYVYQKRRLLYGVKKNMLDVIHYRPPHALLSSLKLPYSGAGDVTLLPWSRDSQGWS
jgi:hypothetical protein